MALTFASLNLTNGPSSFQQPFEIESRGSDPPPPASCDIEAQPSYDRNLTTSIIKYESGEGGREFCKAIGYFF